MNGVENRITRSRELVHQSVISDREIAQFLTYDIFDKKVSALHALNANRTGMAEDLVQYNMRSDTEVTLPPPHQ